jgi:hypothetical protein
MCLMTHHVQLCNFRLFFSPRQKALFGNTQFDHFHFRVPHRLFNFRSFKTSSMTSTIPSINYVTALGNASTVPAWNISESKTLELWVDTGS